MTRRLFLNINRVMAIRSCPYCKAIIDEGSEYCSNCGTQLLFPEDEHIHEEIPGEKIVEEEAPEEENQKKRKSSSRKRKKKEVLQELEPVETEEEAEPVPAVEVEETEETVEEEIAIDMKEIEETDDIEKSDESSDGEKPPEEERDEFFVEAQEPAFGTEDLEKVIDPEEKEKAEIEKFLKSLKEDRDEWDGEIPPTDELPPWAEKIKDEKPNEIPAVDTGGEEELPAEESPPIEEEEKAMEEVLKPMGLTPEDEVPEIQIPEEEAVEEEIAEEEEPPEKLLEEETLEEEASMPDTGMGLPEGVDQEKLPFVDKSTGEFDEEEESPPSKLSSWLKSRAFDVLFIAALWIVTLHIASRMLSTNLFKLISVSALPAVAFYLALLAVYLFLFFLFLGQTLGDHLFHSEE